MPFTRDYELSRGHATVLFELAAKMRGLLETDLEGDILDSINFPQECLGMHHALFVQPLLRRTPQSKLRLPLELTGGDLT